MPEKKSIKETKEKKSVLTEEDKKHFDASMNYNDELLRKLAKL